MIYLLIRKFDFKANFLKIALNIGNNKLSNIFTINGRIIDCEGIPLEGFHIIDTGIFLIHPPPTYPDTPAVDKSKPDLDVPPDYKSLEIPSEISSHTPDVLGIVKPVISVERKVSETITDSNGRFTFTFDSKDIEKTFLPLSEMVSSPNSLFISVLEPGGALLARSVRKKPLYNSFDFDMTVSTVSVVNWQLYYPSGASNFILGDTVVLTAYVRNKVQREVNDLTLSVSMSPLCLDDKNANSYRDLVEPFNLEVGMVVPLDPVGTKQIGNTRFDPDPLSAQPIAIAFQIPLFAIIVDDTITLGSYAFAPSGLYHIEVALTAENTVCDRTSFEVCVFPGTRGREEGGPSCGGSAPLLSYGRC